MNHQVKAAGKEAQSVFVVGPLKEENQIIKNKEKKKQKQRCGRRPLSKQRPNTPRCPKFSYAQHLKFCLFSLYT